MSASELGRPPRELNKQTAKVGNWLFCVSHACIEEYSYQWGGVEVTNKKLRVLLCSIDEDYYATGIMKAFKKNFVELEDAFEKS